MWAGTQYACVGADEEEKKRKKRARAHERERERARGCARAHARTRVLTGEVDTWTYNIFVGSRYVVANRCGKVNLKRETFARKISLKMRMSA